MEVEFLKEEKDFLQVKLIGKNIALCNLVAEKLGRNSEVEFAGCNEDHPLLGNPILTVKGKSPKKQFREALKEVEKQLKEVEKAVASL